jgi:hypothetical protein
MLSVQCDYSGFKSRDMVSVKGKDIDSFQYRVNGKVVFGFDRKGALE